ncbi:PTS transporter subunit EIIC [Paenibacillus sp. OSY-SE]|uniref:PTS transporter subunit EIIC n=1 Tax=Paenibacillus sp. OSY-SE TaxID=1196323 RepID=UPI0002ED3C9D|nr:PTS transporter subunit EIIC [Paenibacillus sp. OSY-SE]
MRLMSYMQQIGRSLMIPIAVLPAASILVRIGEFQFETPWLAAVASVCKLGGDAIFGNLPIFFAIGVAIGLTSGQGVAALAAAVGYFVFTNVLKHFETGAAAELDTGVLGGMLCGGLAAWLYQRFHQVKLPEALGFFGGKRFVPLITSLIMVVVGVGVGFIWPSVQQLIREVGTGAMTSSEWGAGIYGILNRLLIPTGLHHILNNIAWFQLGEFTNTAGSIIRGDMWRFHAGDPTAGLFMAGFFPVMMFGLPGYAMAIVHAAHREERKRIASIMLTASLTSFLTGITEPLEFAFMLTVPLLYAIHAVFTGVAMMLTAWLDIRAGFGFSAGFIDMVITWTNGRHMWLLLLLGLIYFGLYYTVASLAIKVFHLQTPGRRETALHEAVQPTGLLSDELESKLEQIIGCVGGMSNIRSVDACITRLRLQLWDDAKVDEAGLLMLGAFGFMRVAKGHVHIIMGTDSDILREKIEQRLGVAAYING